MLKVKTVANLDPLSGFEEGDIVLMARDGRIYRTTLDELKTEIRSEGGIALNDLSGTAPIAYNNTTGRFSITAATTSAAGSMSATDKTKLDGIATGATANSTDAQLRDRSTHTGSQAIGTITGLQSTLTALDTKQAGSIHLTTLVSGVSLSNALKVPRINAAGDGIEFVTQSSGGGGISLTDLSATLPLAYDNTTGVFSLPAATGSSAGYLSAADKTTINNLATTYQPLDSDLTAIAALTTATYGRSLLTLADAAAGRSSLGLGTAATADSSTFQPVDSDLTAIAALSTTTYGRSLLTLADAAAGRTSLGVAIGTDVQAYSPRLGEVVSGVSVGNALKYARVNAAGNAIEYATVSGSGGTRQTFSNANATLNAATTFLAQTGSMSAARTVTLPAANTVTTSDPIVIVDESGSVTSINKITLARSGSDTINGATSVDAIFEAYGTAILTSDGSSKWVVKTLLPSSGTTNQLLRHNGSGFVPTSLATLDSSGNFIATSIAGGSYQTTNYDFVICGSGASQSVIQSYWSLQIGGNSGGSSTSAGAKGNVGAYNDFSVVVAPASSPAASSFTTLGVLKRNGQTGGFLQRWMSQDSGGTITNLATMDLSGNLATTGTVTATKFLLSALNTAPSSASDTGATGEIRIDANYLYVCTATNTWKRTALSTW